MAALLVYMPVRRRRVNQPLTPLARLQKAPPFEVDVVRKPRLTSNGKVIVVMVVAFGVVAVGVSLAVVTTTGLTPALVPVVGMGLLIDLVPFMAHRLETASTLGPFGLTMKDDKI